MAWLAEVAVELLRLGTSYSFSLVLLQCLLLALYRIVFPVRILLSNGITSVLSQRRSKVNIYLIHCGMGLFCLPFLARMRFTLNVFKADMAHYKTL